MRSLAPLAVSFAALLTAVPVCAQQAPGPSPAPPQAQAPQQGQAGKAEQLPPVTVIEPPEKKTAPPKASKAKGSAPPIPAVATSAPTASTAEAGAAQAGPLVAETQAFDSARDNLLTQIGTNSFSMNRDALAAVPGGTNTPMSKVLLQAPGVSQDSVASGQIHVRNEHANVQYRINGIILPDGVSGFSQVLDTAFVGNLSLITGALPAEYGLRTSGLIDIQTRSGAFDGGGSVGVYGGSRETVTPSFEYGGTSGQTEYFVTGRYFGSNEGIENPTASVVPIHDDTEQGAFFSYVSTLLNPNTRLSWISGSTINQYQIPNSPGQNPAIHALRRADLQFVAAQRTAIRAELLRRGRVAAEIGIPSIGSLRTSRATAISTSRPTSSATSSSTVSRPTSSARASSTACRVMGPTRSTIRILCARASSSAASRRT